MFASGPVEKRQIATSTSLSTSGARFSTVKKSKIFYIDAKYTKIEEILTLKVANVMTEKKNTGKCSPNHHKFRFSISKQNKYGKKCILEKFQIENELGAGNVNWFDDATFKKLQEKKKKKKIDILSSPLSLTNGSLSSPFRRNNSLSDDKVTPSFHLLLHSQTSTPSPTNSWRPPSLGDSPFVEDPLKISQGSQESPSQMIKTLGVNLDDSQISWTSSMATPTTHSPKLFESQHSEDLFDKQKGLPRALFSPGPGVSDNESFHCLDSTIEGYNQPEYLKNDIKYNDKILNNTVEICDEHFETVKQKVKSECVYNEFSMPLFSQDMQSDDESPVKQGVAIKQDNREKHEDVSTVGQKVKVHDTDGLEQVGQTAEKEVEDPGKSVKKVTQDAVTEALSDFFDPPSGSVGRRRCAPGRNKKRKSLDDNFEDLFFEKDKKESPVLGSQSKMKCLRSKKRTKLDINSPNSSPSNSQTVELDNKLTDSTVVEIPERMKSMNLLVTMETENVDNVGNTCRLTNASPVEFSKRMKSILSTDKKKRKSRKRVRFSDSICESEPNISGSENTSDHRECNSVSDPSSVNLGLDRKTISVSAGKTETVDVALDIEKEVNGESVETLKKVKDSNEVPVSKVSEFDDQRQACFTDDILSEMDKSHDTQGHTPSASTSSLGMLEKSARLHDERKSSSDSDAADDLFSQVSPSVLNEMCTVVTNVGRTNVGFNNKWKDKNKSSVSEKFEVDTSHNEKDVIDRKTFKLSENVEDKVCPSFVEKVLPNSKVVSHYKKRGKFVYPTASQIAKPVPDIVNGIGFDDLRALRTNTDVKDTIQSVTSKSNIVESNDNKVLFKSYKISDLCNKSTAEKKQKNECSDEMAHKSKEQTNVYQKQRSPPKSAKTSEQMEIINHSSEREKSHVNELANKHFPCGHLDGKPDFLDRNRTDKSHLGNNKFYGFSSASGSEISLSENALQKAELLLQEESDNSKRKSKIKGLRKNDEEKTSDKNSENREDAKSELHNRIEGKAIGKEPCLSHGVGATDLVMEDYDEDMVFSQDDQDLQLILEMDKLTNEESEVKLDEPGKDFDSNTASNLMGFKLERERTQDFPFTNSDVDVKLPNGSYVSPERKTLHANISHSNISADGGEFDFKDDRIGVPSCGFSTASGKLLKVSDEKLRKAKHFVESCVRDDVKLDNETVVKDKTNMSVVKKSDEIFPVDVGMKAEKSHNLVDITSRTDSDLPDKNSDAGFTTESGKKFDLKISDIAKAKSFFEDEFCAKTGDIKHFKNNSQTASRLSTGGEKKLDLKLPNVSKATPFPLKTFSGIIDKQKSEIINETCVGFKTASGKKFDLNPSNIAKAESVLSEFKEELPCKDGDLLQMGNFTELSFGFKTASGKNFDLKPANLAMAKSLFSEIQEESKSENNNNEETINGTETIPGFTMASGKHYVLKPSNIAKAKTFFSEEFCDESGDAKPLSMTEIVPGFSTASGKKLDLQPSNIFKAKSLFSEFQEELGVDMDNSEQTNVELFSTATKIGQGFSTASGKKLNLQPSNISKAKSLFSEFQEELGVDMDSIQQAKAKPFKKTIEIGQGFSTASGKKLDLQPLNVSKAKSLFFEFQEELGIDMDSNQQSNKKLTTTEIGLGFSTASGTGQPNVSKANSLFSQFQKDLDLDLCRNQDTSMGFALASGKNVYIQKSNMAKAQSSISEFQNTINKDVNDPIELILDAKSNKLSETESSKNIPIMSLKGFSKNKRVLTENENESTAIADNIPSSTLSESTNDVSSDGSLSNIDEFETVLKQLSSKKSNSFKIPQRTVRKSMKSATLSARFPQGSNIPQGFRQFKAPKIISKPKESFVGSKTVHVSPLSKIDNDKISVTEKHLKHKNSVIEGNKCVGLSKLSSASDLDKHLNEPELDSSMMNRMFEDEMEASQRFSPESGKPIRKMESLHAYVQSIPHISTNKQLESCTDNVSKSKTKNDNKMYGNFDKKNLKHCVNESDNSDINMIKDHCEYSGCGVQSINHRSGNDSENTHFALQEIVEPLGNEHYSNENQINKIELKEGEFPTFQTASGKNVSVSENAKKKVGKLFEGDENELPVLFSEQSHTDIGSGNTSISHSNHFGFPAFQTASGKNVSVSDIALKKIKKLFDDDDDEQTEIKPDSYTCTSSVSFPAFQTASGKDVKVSESALKNVRKLLNEGDSSSVFNSDICDQNKNFLSFDKNIETCLMEKTDPNDNRFNEDIPVINEGVGGISTFSLGKDCFKTASGKSISISENALEKSKLVLQDSNSGDQFGFKKDTTCSTTMPIQTGPICTNTENEENFILPDKMNVENRGSNPFKTASGESVVLSNDALQKTRLVFVDEKLQGQQAKIETAMGHDLPSSLKLDSQIVPEKKSMSLVDLGSLSDRSADISDEPFKMASGREVSILKQALEKVKQSLNVSENTSGLSEQTTNTRLSETRIKSEMDDDHGLDSEVENIQMDISEHFANRDENANKKESVFSRVTIDVSVCPFQSASGKAVTISENALQKARKSLQEDLNAVHKLDNSNGALDFNSRCPFQSASGKTVKISENSLKQARKTLTDGSTSPFQSASGKNITVSESSLKLARKTLSDDDGFELRSAADAYVNDNVNNRSYSPFQSASGTKINISEHSLEKAKKVLDSKSDSLMAVPESELNRRSSSTVPSHHHSGSPFQSATGKTVSVSIDALNKARQILDGGVTGNKLSDVHGGLITKHEINHGTIQGSGTAMADRDDFTVPDELFDEMEPPPKRFKTDCGYETNNADDNGRDLHTRSMKPITVLPEDHFMDRRSTNLKLQPLHSHNLATKTRAGTPILSYEDSGPQTPTSSSKTITKTVFKTPYKVTPSKTAVVDPQQSSVCSNLKSPVPVFIPKCTQKVPDQTHVTHRTESSKTMTGDLNVGSGSLAHKGSSSDLCNVDMVKGIKEARDRQTEMIEKKKSSKVRPVTGRLFEMKESSRRIKLIDVIGLSEKLQRKPKRHSTVVVNKDVQNVRSCNAEGYTFQIKHHYGNVDHVYVGDGAYLLPRGDGMAGKEEFYRGFLTIEGVDPSLVTDKWFYNHYRWIVWKLAAYEITSPYLFAGRSLTPEMLMLQMKYRYDREIDRCHRSAIKKILEKDDSANKTMVLCVTEIQHTHKDNTSTSSAVTKQNKEVVNLQSEVLLKLTDGWYEIPVKIDHPLTSLVNKGVIVNGCKLCVSGAELMGADEACSPLEAPSTVMLKINANSTRPARWDAKLGFQTDPRPLCVPLTGLYSDGGVIGCIDVILARRYPIMYMEKASDGVCIFRSEQSEEKAKQIHQNIQQEKMEKMYRKIEKKFEVEEMEDKCIYKKKWTEKEVEYLQSGQDIYEALLTTAQTDILESYLSEQQITLLMDYRRKLQDEKQQKLQSEFHKAWNDGDQNSSKRNVVPLIKFRVVGCSKKDLDNKASTVITVWRPTAEILELGEGKRYKIFSLTAGSSRSKYIQNEVQLTATRQTRFKPVSIDENLLDMMYEEREVSCVSDLRRRQPVFGEVDYVGFVVSVVKTEFIESGKEQDMVYTADINGDILGIKFWNGIKQSGLEDTLSEGRIFCACNLMDKSLYRSTVLPVLEYSSEFTLMSQTGKYPSHRRVQDKLKAVSKNKKEFLNQSKETLEELLQRKRQVYLNKTPERQFQGDQNESDTDNMGHLEEPERSFQKTFVSPAKATKDKDNSQMEDSVKPSTMVSPTNESCGNMTLEDCAQTPNKSLNKIKMAKLLSYGSPSPLSPLMPTYTKRVNKAFKPPMVKK